MSGFINLRAILDKGIKVGLGSDVSGGSSCSILKAINDAMTVSRAVNLEKGLLLKEAFYLATLGNARVMSLEDKIGNFIVGKCFDALLIDIKTNDSAIVLHDQTDDIYDKFQKFIFTGDDRNIDSVYVNGRLVNREKRGN